MADIKIIRHLPSRIDVQDDPAFPFKLEVNLRPQEFMQVTFVMLYGGSEELVVRGISREALDRFITTQELREHPRLRWLKITAPDGTITHHGPSTFLQYPK
jgi:hypothetical protein